MTPTLAGIPFIFSVWGFLWHVLVVLAHVYASKIFPYGEPLNHD